MHSQATANLVVIHGWGISHVRAVAEIHGLFRLNAWRAATGFLLPQRQGLAVQRLLRDETAGRLAENLRRLVVSQLLPCRRPPPENPGDTMTIEAEEIAERFEYLGIPANRRRLDERARRLAEDAGRELAGVTALLGTVVNTPELALLPENAARARLAELAAEMLPPDNGFMEFLDLFRAWRETGGDLDTVASAAFYAHWLKNRATSAAGPHPPPCEFVFLNYHENLEILGVGRSGPADIYLADFPLGALPDLEKRARALAAKGLRLRRFEDHHPWTKAQRQALENLRRDGILERFELAGPEEGVAPEAEPDPSALRCGADVVHANLLAGTPADGPGARTLRAAAHGEDFVSDRTELGILLTALIKGGFSKTELVQLLVESMPADNALEMLRQRRLPDLAERWEDEFKETGDQLCTAAYMLRVTPAAAPAAQEKPLSILVANAVRRTKAGSKIPVGRAVEYYSQRFPEADYVFYCYGADLMVARRLNRADRTLDLGNLMPRLGGDGDGGHAGAAVGRPANSPQYPQALLGERVGADNFGRFVRYLAFRLGREGLPVSKIRDCSTPPAPSQDGAGRRLALVAAIAVLLGILLVLCFPSFRPAAVREGNRDFYPQLNAPGLSQPAPAPAPALPATGSKTPGEAAADAEE